MYPLLEKLPSVQARIIKIAGQVMEKMNFFNVYRYEEEEEEEEDDESDSEEEDSQEEDSDEDEEMENKAERYANDFIGDFLAQMRTKFSYFVIIYF